MLIGNESFGRNVLHLKSHRAKCGTKMVAKLKVSSQGFQIWALFFMSSQQELSQDQRNFNPLKRKG